MKKYLSVIMGLALALVFALLYITGVLTPLENQMYDFFLRFRANRQHFEDIVFLNIDDPAIDYHGLWPVPRYVTADGLLRLKEYESLDVIYDIQFIDFGPKGINNEYLEEGLDEEFAESLSLIHSALSSGLLQRSELSQMIDREYAALRSKTFGIVRDIDTYLAQCIALNGNAWSTISRQRSLITGEWAERRAIAESRFAYPVTAAADAHRGGEGFVDILTTLPMISTIAKGAGFTNYDLDSDGVIRRTYLTQYINDHWYLQLSFAPLIDYLGRPELLLEKNKLTIKGARFPDGRVKDIIIPLDSKGHMMLNWPKEDFYDSYNHVSFADFSLLDDIEKDLEHKSRILIISALTSSAASDHSLSRVFEILKELEDTFNTANEAKKLALENTSDYHFNNYVLFRNKAYSLLEELFSMNVGVMMPEFSSQINTLKETLEKRNELNAKNENIVRGKFVIIGFVAEGTTESGPSPFHPDYVYTGIPAVILDTILSESFLVPLGIWWSVIFLLIFVPVFILISEKLPHVIRAVTGFAAVAVIFVSAILLFRFTGIFWGPLGTIIALTIVIVAREIIAFAGSEKEKHFIRSAFSTYVSGDVVKEIIADPSRLQLGGANRHMTAIFTDVKAFSTISEQLHPEELVSLLNRYLSAMSDIVLAEKGTIDKYEGDAIIAFFGAPLELPDHALRACISAINMKKTEAELNKIITEQKLSPIPLYTRIGINTGNMVAGNMGTANKMNYTIMGNAVNLAARLEGVNKQYGTWILASEDTIRETGEHILSRKLDRVRVVGINEPVRLYELLDTFEYASEQDKKLVKVFHEALSFFETRNWKQAADGFREAFSIKEDAPSKLYIERCEQLITAPPDNNWDGVYNLTAK